MALSLIDSLDDDEYLLIASHIHIDEQGNATSSETWKLYEAFICVYLLGLLGRKGYPKALEVKKVICKNIIPETIDGLVNLEELVVKGQEIQSIPYEVFHCKKLKTWSLVNIFLEMNNRYSYPMSFIIFII